MVDRGLGVSLAPDWAPTWPAGLFVLKNSDCCPRRSGAWASLGRDLQKLSLISTLLKSTNSQAAGLPEFQID